MDEETFNLILKIGSYNGDECYYNYQELESDYKITNGVSLTPEEVRRLIFTAYQFGKNEKKEDVS